MARHFSLPANAAKKVLSEFLEKNQGKVSATYLISGWTKSPEPEHTIQLVDSGALIERRKTLEPITSLHVYSVQPTQPKVNITFYLPFVRQCQARCWAVCTLKLKRLPHV